MCVCVRGNYTLPPRIISLITICSLHSKLLECTFCFLNYDLCYTLHSDIKFAINLDGKV